MKFSSSVFGWKSMSSIDFEKLFPCDTSWQLSRQYSLLQECRSCLRGFPLRSYLSSRDKWQSSGDPIWPLTYTPGESIGALRIQRTESHEDDYGNLYYGKSIFCFVRTHSNSIRSIHSLVPGCYGLSWTPCNRLMAQVVLLEGGGCRDASPESESCLIKTSAIRAFFCLGPIDGSDECAARNGVGCRVAPAWFDSTPKFSIV
jgi:hypothetical protein